MLTRAILVAFGALFTYNTRVTALCWQGTACGGPQRAAFSGDWDRYYYSPTSRISSPVNVLKSDNSPLSSYQGSFHLRGNGSMLIFDFGQEVGGLVTVSYGAVGTGSLGLAFSEAKNFTG